MTNGPEGIIFVVQILTKSYFSYTITCRNSEISFALEFKEILCFVTRVNHPPSGVRMCYGKQSSLPPSAQRGECCLESMCGLLSLPSILYKGPKSDGHSFFIHSPRKLRAVEFFCCLRLLFAAWIGFLGDGGSQCSWFCGYLPCCYRAGGACHPSSM